MNALHHCERRAPRGAAAASVAPRRAGAYSLSDLSHPSASSGSRSKAATRRCIIWAVERLGEEAVRRGLRLHFVTLTFPDDVTWEEAGRRWRNLQRALVRRGQGPWVGAWELTRRGRWHLHVVGLQAGDYALRGKVVGRGYCMAPGDIEVWARWRALASEHGFGRVQVHLVRDQAACGRYVAKYVYKSVQESGRRVTWPGWRGAGIPRPVTAHCVVGGRAALYRAGARALRLPQRGRIYRWLGPAMLRGAQCTVSGRLHGAPHNYQFQEAVRLLGPGWSGFC